MSEAQSVDMLIHEIAHSLMHREDDTTSRKAREVEAESVAYVVSSYLGIDTSSYSFGYVAGWASSKEVKELQESMSRIRNTAHDLIEKIDKKYKRNKAA